MNGDRLTDDERSQILNHSPSCPCDLCQRHRNEIGIGSERERLLLERCEQMVRSDRPRVFIDDVECRWTPMSSEYISATEIEQARGSLAPRHFAEEYLDASEIWRDRVIQEDLQRLLIEELWPIRESVPTKKQGLHCDRVAQWCEANGYTDPFLQERQWWAFPPNGVMPVPLAIAPTQGRTSVWFIRDITC